MYVGTNALNAAYLMWHTEEIDWENDIHVTLGLPSVVGVISKALDSFLWCIMMSNCPMPKSQMNESPQQCRVSTSPLFCEILSVSKGECGTLSGWSTRWMHQTSFRKWCLTSQPCGPAGFFLAQAIFKGKMISLYDEHSLKSTFRCKQIHFFSAAELWTVKTATSNYWTSSLTWTGERPIHLLKAYNVTAPLFSSPSVLSSSLWGCVSM